MNWYSLYKLSQIWVDQRTDSFENNLQAIYGFEYKYAMVNSKLNTTPQRKQNILNHLQEAFNEPTQNVIGVLLKTFGNWLESHALLDPDKWAAQRAKMGEELDMKMDADGGVMEDMLYEYGKYTYPDSRDVYKIPKEKQFSDFIKNVFKNIESMPMFKEFLVDILLPEQRNYLMEMLESEGLKEFNSSSWKKFKTKEEAENYIENLTLNSVDIDDLFYTFMPDKESFNNVLSNIGYKEKILQELYKVLIFPLWRDHWVAQGIDVTRNNVQKIYDSLNSIDYGNMGNTSATINIALNAVHQNGSMIDYIEEEVGEDGLRVVLDNLTNGLSKSIWDEELKKELNIG